MSLLDFLPELQTLFFSRVVACSSLGDDLESEIEDFLFSSVDASLAGPLHTVVRELVQNSIKANLKRLVFDRNHIDPLSPVEYGRGMEQFHRSLSDYDREYFASQFDSENIKFEIIFSIHERVSILHICNPGRLFRQEEERIRRKFGESQGVQGLYEFYLGHSDLTEGAGMGIALSQLLMRQLGFDPRLISIFGLDDLDLTVSRLIIPRRLDYIPPRRRFESLVRKGELDRGELRRRFGKRGLAFLDT